MKKPAKQKPHSARRSRRRVAAEDGVESKALSGDVPPHLVFSGRYKGTLPEIISKSDLETLNLGLGFFFTLLRKARRLYLEEGDSGRAAAFTALGAVWQFIALFKLPHAEHLQVPILQLQNALVALEQNNVLPIKKPIARRGRAASSHVYATMKGFAAGTVARLLEAGIDRKQAWTLVASELTKQGVRPDRGPGKITANTVRHWRDEVVSDVGRHGTAAMAYDSMFGAEENKKFDSLGTAEVQRFALTSLCNYVQELFPERRATAKKPT